MLVRAATHFIAHGTAGAACTRHSLHPPIFEGEPNQDSAHRAARVRRYVLNEAQRMRAVKHPQIAAWSVLHGNRSRRQRLGIGVFSCRDANACVNKSMLNVNMPLDLRRGCENMFGLHF